MTPEPSISSRPSAAGPSVRVTCWAVFVYDIGLAIDLERAGGLLSGPAPGESERRPASGTRPPPPPQSISRLARPTPRYFEFKPPPLRRVRAVPPQSIGRWTTAAHADLVAYDFGAATLAYLIEFDGPLEELVGLADALYDCDPLLHTSRAAMEGVLAEIRGAVTRPTVNALVEDYVVYEFETARTGGAERAAISDPQAFLAEHGPTLARVLRAEPGDLSDQEIADALSCRLHYSPRDAVVIDWNAAALFLKEPEDARSVLEFSNVELLELRHLDNQLDAALQSTAQFMSPVRRRWGVPRWFVPGSGAPELNRLAELQTESSLLFENVNNTLKLVGDQYLARVSRLAGGRLHLPEWDATILRKLGTLESIYQKLTDRRSARRTEMLEWIVILLIALEIVLALVTWRR